MLLKRRTSSMSTLHFCHTVCVFRMMACLDSGSARFNAEQKAKMVQARIDAHKTSHGGALPDSFLGIYSREPNRKCSIFIGNLTWVRKRGYLTGHDIISNQSPESTL